MPGDLLTPIILRSLRTVLGFALGGLALFVAAAIVVDRSFVGDDPAVPFGLLATLYVALGVLAGINLGVATVLRRETAAMVSRSAIVVEPVVERALTRLPVPAEGVSPQRLRELAELRFVTSRRSGFRRVIAAFAVRRAIEQAGLAALQERLLALAEQAESLGQSTVGRESIRAAAREGLTAAVARQLDTGWRASQSFALVAVAVALASLPVLAALAL